MKLPALILAGSLAANAALVAVYLNRSSASSALPPATSGATPPRPSVIAAVSPIDPPVEQSSASAATASSVDPKTWAGLNPGDLRGLVARLRAAGFPPSTIRAIVSAQVTEQTRSKYLELSAQLETKPFWATDGSNYGLNDPKSIALFRELGREHNRMIKDALGPDFPTNDDEIGDYQRRRYGNLPKDKTDQLQRISEDYDDLRQQATTAARGLMLPEDREKLALLEKEKRADLAQLLSPQEMEDYLMRTSNTTMQLRTALTAFNASEAEFRAIYQVKQAFDEKYSNRAFYDAEAMKERTAAQAQVAEQLKASLGEARYAEYARTSDRGFQAINRIAQQANLPPATAIQAYDLRTNASKESNRIYADTALSTDQKRAALASLAQNTRTQLGTTLGAEAGGTYLKIAEDWLGRIERGGAVTFTEGGGTSSRTLPTTRTAAPNPTNPTGAPTTVVAPKTGG